MVGLDFVNDSNFEWKRIGYGSWKGMCIVFGRGGVLELEGDGRWFRRGEEPVRRPDNHYPELLSLSRFLI